MDHIKVLKRAFETTWRYRVLWIFGIILALTTGGGGGQPAGDGGGGNGGNGGFPPGAFTPPEIPAYIISVLVAVGIGLICVIFVLAVAAAVARYVAETALIRMVDDHEETGQQRSVREGFQMGWSRAAFRIFMINLLTGLPVAVVFILAFPLSLTPLLLWVTESTVAGIIGTVAAIGLFFLVLLLAIIVGVVLSLLRKFFWRVCALEELGVIESIQEGWYFVRRHLKDVVLMWLLMVGVSIGWAIVMILLLPAILLLIVLGGVLGGLPALFVWGLSSLFLEGAVPWILAAVVGLPIFLLVMVAPLLFLSGLMEVFKSSVWTLTYRELRALEGLEPGPQRPPELNEPDLTDSGEEVWGDETPEE